MSNHLHARRSRRVAIAVAAVLALGIVPAAAGASPVLLGTASPFVALGGSTVTNSGPSVLKGELGLAPGTSLTGFEAPALVTGAIHKTDAVASKAQGALTTAFGVAGKQPVTADLTGIDLDGLTLTPGAYSFSSSAQLTGQVTLDAEGHPDAQFVFIIGTTLTTASASSVKMINGASPCNVYWRVGSSATLGSESQFQGNVMALTDISLTNDIHVEGRLLAGGAITLNDDVLDNSQCTKSEEGETTPEVTTPISTTPTPVTPPVETGGTTGTTAPGTTPVASKGQSNTKVHQPTPTPTGNGSSTVSHGEQGPNGTPVKVTGKRIGKIVISVGGHRVKTSHGSSVNTTVNGTPGTHTVTVHVKYKDHTPGKTTTFRIHVPKPAPLTPRSGPSAFTG